MRNCRRRWRRHGRHGGLASRRLESRGRGDGDICWRSHRRLGGGGRRPRRCINQWRARRGRSRSRARNLSRTRCRSGCDGNLRRRRRRPLPHGRVRKLERDKGADPRHASGDQPTARRSERMPSPGCGHDRSCRDVAFDCGEHPHPTRRARGFVVKHRLCLDIGLVDRIGRGVVIRHAAAFHQRAIVSTWRAHSASGSWLFPRRLP